uniref:NADH-ubiquinone oxidoreductase chain 5 n=1 Tax=Xibalbanus tulumensis TaxID=1519145 RepID=Q6SKY5_XIBTU|nr:NADH dehydrogenase subunit 5 [Xibalbanus tulumensis]AAS00888.1 NADH dehydrogenase subunit 5 [Xibalbanus tulumensis]
MMVFLILISLVGFVLGLVFFMFNYTYIIEWVILDVYGLFIVASFLFDWMSLVFLSVVGYISSCIMLYSVYYMSGDTSNNRFIMLVFMFVVSMFLLVMSPNLISILLGWDGLGLVSYLLIVYYQNSSSSSAGMFTAMCNRVGDVFILLAISWMVNYGSWGFLYYTKYMLGFPDFFLVSVFIMIASITSSAQIPFCAWLPAAMAAPTPVSALVHSSTLVTAGVYLLIRFSSSIFYYKLNDLLLIISLITMFLSGLGANFEYDIKKIVALSTLSQLGFMIFIMSVGGVELAFFHLLVHALFKALLFMGVGVLIHNAGEAQDIRMYGCMGSYFPFTSSCVLISVLSMCGVPFMSGFYSSDLILEYSVMGGPSLMIYLILFFCIGLTVCYSFRFIYWVFCGNFMGSPLFSFNEYSMEMMISMLMLVVFSVFGGSALGWSILSVPYFVCISMFLSVLVMCVLFFGMWVGYLFLNFRDNYVAFNYIKVNAFFGTLWFMKYLTSSGMIYFPFNLGGGLFKVSDLGWFEKYGGQGLYMGFYNGFGFIRYIQENGVGVYFVFFVFWVVLYFFLL